MIEEFAGGHKTSIEVAKQNVLAQAGIVRFGEADDVAELLAFLVSTRARRLTGTALHIDGGEVEAI
jgi:3-oxoacyl-[acyl-carrier protein] reductase